MARRDQDHNQAGGGRGGGDMAVPPQNPGAPAPATSDPTVKEYIRANASSHEPTVPDEPEVTPGRRGPGVPSDAEVASVRQLPTSQPDQQSGTPPSSLDMNRDATAAQTGRQEMEERRDEHTDTSPAITSGDVDADWETGAPLVGDEAPGGDNPTPDQDIVDEVGRAVGLEYEDSEELRASQKVDERDRHRWELDPASSEDYPERAKEEAPKRGRKRPPSSS